MSTRTWRLIGGAATTTAVLTAILGPWRPPTVALTIGVCVGAIAVSVGALGIVIARRPLPVVPTGRCGPAETLPAVEVCRGDLLDTHQGPVWVTNTRVWADRDGKVTVTVDIDGGTIELPAATTVTIRRPI